MKKYDYPKEVNENNFQELVKRSKEITNKSSTTYGVSLFLSFVLILAFMISYVPSLRTIYNPQVAAEVGIAISMGVALFVIVFLSDIVNIFLRRIFNSLINYYPSPEEFVFAQCFLTATIFDRIIIKAKWAGAIRTRSIYLSEEFSRFTKYDLFNFRRKAYANEFRLLASGEMEIERMLMFSERKNKEILINFALSLVNNDDPKAFIYLKSLICEVEKYGKMENLPKRIENQITSLRGIVALIGAMVAIIATIVGLVLKII